VPPNQAKQSSKVRHRRPRCRCRSRRRTGRRAARTARTRRPPPTRAGRRTSPEGDDNDNGFDFLPRSNPIFCNLTLVGTGDQPGSTGGSGALLRRGTAGKIVDSIFTEFHTGGLALFDDATARRACVDHATLQTTEPFLAVAHSIFTDDGAGGGVQLTSSLTSAAPCTGAEWYDLLVEQTGVLPARGSGTGPDTHIVTTYPTAVTDQFVPAGVTCPGPDPVCDSADCHALDPGLDTTDWVGAFRPGGENWLRPDPGACWISFADR